MHSIPYATVCLSTNYVRCARCARAHCALRARCALRAHTALRAVCASRTPRSARTRAARCARATRTRRVQRTQHADMHTYAGQRNQILYTPTAQFKLLFYSSARNLDWIPTNISQSYCTTNEHGQHIMMLIHERTNGDKNCDMDKQYETISQ